MAQLEGGAPALAPCAGVTVVLGPGKVLGELRGNGVEVQRGVAVVPAEHLEGRQVVAVRGCREMGKADLPLVAHAVVGDEEQVILGPGGPLGAVGRGALLERHLAENAAQCHDGESLWLELDEEDAPRLVRHERPKTLNLLNLGSVLRVDPQLFWGVLEGQLLEVIAVDRPAHFAAQVGNELVEALDARECAAVVGRHRLSPR